MRRQCAVSTTTRWRQRRGLEDRVWWSARQSCGDSGESVGGAIESNSWDLRDERVDERVRRNVPNATTRYKAAGRASRRSSTATIL